MVDQVNANATGSLVNTATVSQPANDTNPNNGSATYTKPLKSRADLSIMKSDGTDTLTAGATTTYTVTVANNGPSAVTAAPVTDMQPGGMTFTS